MFMRTLKQVHAARLLCAGASMVCVHRCRATVHVASCMRAAKPTCLHKGQSRHRHWLPLNSASSLFLPPSPPTQPHQATDIDAATRPLSSDASTDLRAKDAPPHHRTTTVHPTPSSPPRPWQSSPAMAMLLQNNYNSSKSSGARKISTESSRRSNAPLQKASAYVVSAPSMALTGLHFSTSSTTCGAGAAGWWV